MWRNMISGNHYERLVDQLVDGGEMTGQLDHGVAGLGGGYGGETKG